MFRIAALNSSESNENDEIQIAKEAQEAIVESEYIRALTLKNQGQPEVAQKLLTDLLQSHILNEGAKENIEKLWTIRYNCHKYLAFIAEENEDNEDAFHNYLAAMQIDNRDVNTIYRFGELLALKLCNLELAEYAFETCLLYNKRHWRAINGLLSVYAKTNNIMASYGLALKLIKTNFQTKHVVNIMKEITTKFTHILPLCETVYGKVPDDIQQLPTTTNFEYFTLSIKSEEEDDEEATNNHKNYIPHDLPKLNATDDLSFFTIGKYIWSTVHYLKERDCYDMLALTFNDICSLKNEPEVTIVNVADDSNSKLLNESSAMVNNQQTDIDSNAEQTQEPNENTESVNSKSDEDSGKSKSRRRCSDLHHLEQWGWHKTRKASRRKTQTERTDVDNSLTGFLKRTFAKYTETNFETSWPFSDNNEAQNIDLDEIKCVVCKETISLADFKEDTKDVFAKFSEKLKTEKFDLMLLNFWWLKYMATLWDKPLPSELKTLFIDLFSLYINCFDFSTWNQLKPTLLFSSVQICLLYLELDYTKSVDENSPLSDLWTMTFNKLLFNYGCTLIEYGSEQDILSLRMLNLEFLRYDLSNQCEQCVQSLGLMSDVLKTQPDSFVVHLPNINSVCLSYENIVNTRKKQERIIDLKQMPQMAKKKQWLELSLLIKKYIQSTENRYKCDNWLIDFKKMNELLLQCLWNIAEYEECLIYAEKFMHYSTYYYLQEQKSHWSKAITYALSYIEAIILNEGCEIVNVLEECLARLIQNIINILSYQLDTNTDKKSYFTDEPEMRRSWLILHQILLRNENIEPNTASDMPDSKAVSEEPIPMSFMLLFTAHEYLGNRQTCTSDGGQFLNYIFQMIIPNLRAPIYDFCRVYTYEYIEQITFCLYGFPPKKGRSRHLEDHNSTLMDLTWQTAIDIFDIYAPETLPEFNSYKVESITIDMEQFLLKILSLMPKELEPTSATQDFKLVISGVKTNEISDECSQLPFKIKNIYYLLADYYFKSRDFQKAIKYYIFDLAVNMLRFDSWAGISLSKASIVETKLNGLTQIDIPQFLKECEEVICCFDKCINLVQNHILVWIEYGSFAYTIGAFCSRNLKTVGNDTTSTPCLVEGKSRMLNIAYNCFSLAASLQNTDVVNLESYEEKWLCQYMLGKIAEKRRDKPNVYLNYYLTASNYLYECSATYPIKINHNSPTTLSVEALEVFYRTNAAILKYVQNGNEVTKEIAILFKNVLHTLSNSPFAFNKAKIDGNCIYALKRKNEDSGESSANKKVFEQPTATSNSTSMSTTTTTTTTTTSTEVERNESEDVSGSSTTQSDNHDENKGTETKKIEDVRRSSQESTATSNTTSTTSTSSLSNFESDSDSSSLDNQHEKSANTTSVELESIYKEVLKNLEECLIRFPEHYKSIYRLVHFYMNGPQKYHDLSQCEKLLLHQYRTRLGNIINGLFYDRKTNNIFNGVWRIPSSEIDRPGSFSAHLVKCVRMLIELLRKQNNYKTFIDIILQLYRSPDNDKRYIMETDRIALFETSLQYCEGIMSDILDNNKKLRNDFELLNLLIDIYKIQKKCYKYVIQKNSWFSKIFVSVYMFYIEDKIQNRPPDLNYYDLAVKLCVQEINYRKNIGKLSNPIMQHTNPAPVIPTAPPTTTTPTLVTEDYTRYIEYFKQLIERGQQPIDDLQEIAQSSALPLSLPTFNLIDNTEALPESVNYTTDNNKKI